MTEAEKQNAISQGVDPVEFKVAIDGIAIITNKGNTVTELTLDQLAKIYNGTYTNWNQVGGADRAIVLYGRQPTSWYLPVFRRGRTEEGQGRRIGLCSVHEAADREPADTFPG